MSIQRRPKTGGTKGKIQWVVRWRDSSGKERSKTFKRESDAKTFDAEVKKEQRKGHYDTEYNRQITLEDFARETVMVKPLEEASVKAYEQTLKNLCGHGIATMKLASITTYHVQGFYKECLDGRSWADDKPLSVVSANSHLALLKRLLEDAYVAGIIPRNPAKNVSKINHRKLQSVKRSEIPTEAQVEALMDAFTTGGIAYVHAPGTDKKPYGMTMREHPEFAFMVKICSCTGLRLSELAGLVVGDVDTTNRLISVEYQKTNVGDNRKKLKTPYSIREVPYPDSVHDDLTRLVADRPRDDFLFVTQSGSAYSSTTIANFMRRACKHLDIAPFTFHSFRHYYASRMIAAGCPVNVISRLLGHASVRVTMEIYVHLLDDSPALARRVVNEIF